MIGGFDWQGILVTLGAIILAVIVGCILRRHTPYCGKMAIGIINLVVLLLLLSTCYTSWSTNKPPCLTFKCWLICAVFYVTLQFCM